MELRKSVRINSIACERLKQDEDELSCGGILIQAAIQPIACERLKLGQLAVCKKEIALLKQGLSRWSV